MKIKLVAVVLALSGIASANIAVRQCGGGSYGGISNTVSISPLAGNTLIVGITNYNSDAPTSVRASNNVDLTQDSWVTARREGFYRYSNVPAGITGITVTHSQSRYSITMVCEVSGLDASPVDAMDGVGNSANSTSWTAGAVTTSGGAIVFGIAYTGARDTYSAVSPWTIGYTIDDAVNAQGGVMVYRMVASAGSYTPGGSRTAATSHHALAAAYKGDVTPPPVNVSRRRATIY